jgi:hypothetical protein
MSTKRMSRKTNKSINTNAGYKTPSYRPLGNNMYALTNSKGNRYRVRMTINGVKYDEYFTNKSVAMNYRKDLIKTKG